MILVQCFCLLYVHIFSRDFVNSVIICKKLGGVYTSPYWNQTFESGRLRKWNSKRLQTLNFLQMMTEFTKSLDVYMYRRQKHCTRIITDCEYFRFDKFPHNWKESFEQWLTLEGIVTDTAYITKIEKNDDDDCTITIIILIIIIHASIDKLNSHSMLTCNCNLNIVCLAPCSVP